MTAAVLDVLPIAIGLLVASAPLVMVSLALVIKRTALVGWSFVGGWILGLFVASAALVALADVLHISGGQGPILGALGLVLGLLLVGLGVRKWHKAWRHHGDDEVPSWYGLIETVGSVKAAALGVGMAAGNPKNLLITLSASTVVAEATSRVGEQAVAVAVFVVVGSLAIAAPTVLATIAGARAQPMLTRLDELITRHNAVIVGAVLIVLGAVVASNGLEAI
ncbi:GAP family protein [Gordonia sp. NPDC003376]